MTEEKIADEEVLQTEADTAQIEDQAEPGGPPPEAGLQEHADRVSIPRRPLYAALIPLAFVTGLAAGYIFWGGSSATAPASPPVAAVATEPTPLEPQEMRFDVEVDDDPALGPTDAPITIIEFSDFHCPYCVRFQAETFPSLMAAYPDQIRFVYRDFPVVGGYEAAQAAECADEQGGFWPFHDLLFSGEYSDWTSETYRAYAEQAGLNADILLACLDSGAMAAEVEADARYAAGLGVTGTPTFFINGVPLVGAQPLQAFQQVIDAELAN
ncbi:MAG: DsbA family protein [Anaerolineales bacterium]